MGPYLVCDNGVKYIFTIIDVFSRRDELIATTVYTSPLVLKALLEQWIYRYGLTEVLFTDGGTHFNNYL